MLDDFGFCQNDELAGITSLVVIPAWAGMYSKNHWIPAFAGMTAGVLGFGLCQPVAWLPLDRYKQAGIQEEYYLDDK